MFRNFTRSAILFALLTFGGCSVDNSAVRLDRVLAEDPPKKLSSYGFFKDARANMPQERVVPYELNAPLFSDYALKSRFVYVPKGKAISYAKEGLFEFPIGTTFIKTFAYPADLRNPEAQVRKLETRLLVLTKAGWQARPYIWNAANTEAILSPTGGPSPINTRDLQGKFLSIAYRVPNQNQCKTCHNESGKLVPIAPTSANLNRDHIYGDGTHNQLVQWVRLGILDHAPDPSTVPALAQWNNPASGSLESRARAYLDANCAHCHKPTGSASNTGLFLSSTTTDPTQYGVGKRPVSAGKGSGDFLFDVVPGQPERSILYYRMNSTEPGIAMPELGRTLVHTEAMTLIHDWIKQMKAEPS